MFDFIKKLGKGRNSDATAMNVPPLPKDYKGVLSVLAAYAEQQRTMDFFFDFYVMDVLEALPQETLAAIAEFAVKHPQMFEKHGGDWRRLVRDACQTSDTFHIAVWDLWVVNSEISREKGMSCHPLEFAQFFRENYFRDGSRIDVWTDETMSAARERIEAFRNSANKASHLTDDPRRDAGR